MQRAGPPEGDEGCRPGIAVADEARLRRRSPMSNDSTSSSASACAICRPSMAPATSPDSMSRSRKSVLSLMQALGRRRGTSLFFVTHDFGVVTQTADRVAVMREGRIVETGALEEVLERPAHDYTRQLLAPCRKTSPGYLTTVRRGTPRRRRPRRCRACGSGRPEPVARHAWRQPYSRRRQSEFPTGSQLRTRICSSFRLLRKPGWHRMRCGAH